jgi:hypothetical protein
MRMVGDQYLGCASDKSESQLYIQTLFQSSHFFHVEKVKSKKIICWMCHATL